MKSFLDFEEKNVEKAVQKACADLNVSREKIKYDIISHGSSGIFGLVGTKKALIRVFVPDIQSAQSAPSASVPGHESNAFASDTTQSDKDTVSALVDEAFGEIKEPVKANAPETPKKNKKPQVAKVEKTTKPEKPQKTIKTKPKTPKKPVPKKVPPPATQTKESPSTAPSDPETTDKKTSEAAINVARELALKIFKTMSIEAEMSVNNDSDQCWINVKVGEPGILIGKRGQTLEAIQYLVDKVVNKQCGKGHRVIFDVEGYVESRKTELKDLAGRLANKAVKTGKPSTMTRMNAHDRRIVHVTLKRNNSVRTQSVGDGYYRKLIIFPKKRSQKKSDKAKTKQ